MASTDAEVPQSAAPKPNPRNNMQMFKIFQNVQYNVVQHKKYVKEMIKLYKKLDQDIFRESFKNAIQYLFTFGDTSANVDRVVQFVATFCTSLDDEDEFLLFIFDIIFECQCVSGQSVRYRASQLLAAVLSALDEDADLYDDLCEKLLNSQLDRLQDTRGAVRCRAALALQRLQNPNDPEDEVTREYRFHMMCDPSSSVRRAVVMTIAKTKCNVPYVLQRLCDVDEAVRRAAFLYMVGLPVMHLRVTQRILTLKIGLTERSPRVRRVVEEILVPGWLSTFRGNIIDLLKAIRLDNANHAKDSQYVAGKLLESLFKRLPISELLEWLPIDKSLRLIPAEKLNKETTWYWRHLAEHLQKIDDDETLETVLPDLVVLTGYIRAIVESPCPSETEDPVCFSTRQYVLHELGSMLRVYDATDPTGRSALQTLITDVLTGDYGPLNEDVIRAFVSALELVVPEVSQRMEVVSGVINSMRDPPEPEMPPPPPPVIDDTKTKLERARLRVSLNVAMEAQEEAVRDQNYGLAAECKAKVEEIQKKLEDLNVQPTPPPPPPHAPTIREKLSDAATLNKCLTILNCALDTPQLTTLTPMLRMIFKEMEVEILQNPDILENSLVTVALYGMLDKEFAKENKAFFFANLIDTSNEPIMMKVLQCLVDLLCVHGARVFEETDSQEESVRRKQSSLHSSDGIDDGEMSASVMALTPCHGNTIELLLKMMVEIDCASYRLIIVEGLCRLLYLGHVESASILARLLLLWFNPASVEEDNLRQIIGVFFQTFPATVDGAQEQIQKATLPILRTLANAPSSSPLAEIDQEAVVRFLVSLTRVNHELTDSQGGMAMLVTNSLVRDPTAPEVGLACRMLALLSPPRDGRLASELAVMLRDVSSKLPDKQSARNLTRYLGALEATERASLNKMSHSGVEGTINNEDTLQQCGRVTTSLRVKETRAGRPYGLTEWRQTRGARTSFHSDADRSVRDSLRVEPVQRIVLNTRFRALRALPVRDSRIAVKPALAQPIARSTHVVINETVEEEVEIDETSPSDPNTATVSKELPAQSLVVTVAQVHRPASSSNSSVSDIGPTQDSAEISSSSSSGISPVKKAKVSKGKNKKPNKQAAEPILKPQSDEEKEVKGNKKRQDSDKGVKRTRSQRSLVDLDRSQKAEAEAAIPAETPQRTSLLQDLDVSNVTVRKSVRSAPPAGDSVQCDGAAKRKGKKGGEKKAKEQGVKKPQRVTRGSSGSNRSSPGSLFDSSGDETQLHTIVYDKEFEQSLLNDSSELADSKHASRANMTVPETPDDSEESDPEPEPEPAKTKGKKRDKK